MAAATIPNTFIDNAKVMAKGQVTIPKDVRQALGISNGSRVTFLVENGSVRLINSAVYAMEIMQHEMKSESTDLQTEDDVNKLVKATRDEEN